LAVKHTVLVVDDDADVLDVIASMLEELGCDVVRASSGAEALDTLAGNEKISILITDINMPGMDGHELAERGNTHSSEAESSATIGSRTEAGWFSYDQEAVFRR